MEVSQLFAQYWPVLVSSLGVWKLPEIFEKIADYKIKKSTIELDKTAALNKIETDTQAGLEAQKLQERQAEWISILNNNERLQRGWSGCEEARESLRKEVLALSIQVGINSKAVNGITQAVNDKILPENEKLEIVEIQPRIQKAMNEAKNDEKIQREGTT